MNEIRLFFSVFRRYLRLRLYAHFSKFERAKDVCVDLLYKRRGKYTRPFLHVGMMVLLFIGATFGPMILKKASASNTEVPDILPSGVLTSATESSQNLTTTQGKEVAQFRGGEVIEHEVKDGETVASIAQLYNLKPNTVIWLNNVDEKKPVIKIGQRIKILPVDGVLHKVRRGETVSSIGKKYGLDDAAAQGIVDYPFNTFVNSETFALAVGQDLVVPDGVMPKEGLLPPSSIARVLTPNAGSVSAIGQFVWPTSGNITQNFRFYHKGLDIANRGGGSVLAADSGRVVVAGWIDNSGYGNRIMIDHENGYVTLYGHLSLIQVQVGQTVKRGDVIGQMGSTGRSTGTHLHFEIRRGGVHENPLGYLK